MDGMTAYIVRRALALVPILLLMSIIVFALIRMVPGDPIDVMYGSEGMDAARRTALQQELGLDQPVPSNTASGCGGPFGVTWATRTGPDARAATHRPTPAGHPSAFLRRPLPFAFDRPAAGPARRCQAQFRRRHRCHGLRHPGHLLPNFWSGILFVLVFAVWLGWLPSIGYVSPFQDLGSSLRHLILPAITLGWSLAGTTTRLARSSLLEELGKDYVRTARGKGLRERTVLLTHALRNALIPTVTMIGLQLGFLIGGTVVVETVFAWPGVGLLVVDSIFARDYPVVQGVVLVSPCSSWRQSAGGCDLHRARSADSVGLISSPVRS